jgi:predicted kinase
MNKHYELADLAELRAPSVIMMIGVPGSGKSYIGEQLDETLGLSVLSSDKCREELSGDANDQSVSKEAWNLVYTRAGDAIAEGRSVIIDGTHTNLEIRRRDIQRYKDFGARAVIGVLVITDIDVSLRRNNSRDRVVPEFVIRDMQSNLDNNPPSTDDGFDYILSIKN